MNISETKSIKIFYVESGSVIESNLLDYLQEFGNGDDTSSVEEKEVLKFKIDDCEFDDQEDVLDYCDQNNLSEDDIEEFTEIHFYHVVRYHANYGRKIKSKNNFGTNKESAEAEYIQGLEWFVSEKNWDAPQYFHTKEEAETFKIERAAEAIGVDIEVFLSIERKEKLIAFVKWQREENRKELKIAAEKVYFEKYKNIISRIEPENYKETAERLSAALPEKISRSVFHQIVKHIRK